MTNTNNLQFEKDLQNKTIRVTRYFDASPAQVWRAWTEPELIDQWWAQKPWKTETESMDFSEGGTWRYAMVGPEGERHHCRVDYMTINDGKSFSGNDGFCDADGNINTEMPVMHWENTFEADGDGTTVRVEINFDSEADLEKIIEMGFKEGFISALTNLDELFEKQFA